MQKPPDRLVYPSRRTILKVATVGGAALTAVLVFQRDLRNIFGDPNRGQKPDGPGRPAENEKTGEAVPVTEANTILRTLPDRLPNGTVLEKRETPGAAWVAIQSCSVHARPFPLSFGDSPNLTAEQKEAARRIVLDLERFKRDRLYPEMEENLRSMAQLLSVRQVYREGETPENREEFLAALEMNRKRLKGPGADPGAVARMRRVLLATIGPDGVLAAEGVIDLLPAETLAAREGGEEIMQKGDSEEKRRLQMRRELAVLRTMAGGEGRARIVHFGASHDFAAAQQSWNIQQPQNACSFVRMHAPAVTEYQRRVAGLQEEILRAWGVGK